MTIIVDLQIIAQSTELPSQQLFQQWIETVLAGRKDETELTIRIVDEDESQALNHQYRDKDKPTNVLSFPFVAPPGVEINLLGDLIICANVVKNEAIEQQKTLIAHWAHMVTHGCLHLLGYDHINSDDAQVMERIEIDILLKQGFNNPYATDEQ
jgi:probable rRNA maturation factor